MTDLPAAVLGGRVEGEVLQRPAQAGAGGLRPAPEQVEPRHHQLFLAKLRLRPSPHLYLMQVF